MFSLFSFGENSPVHASRLRRIERKLDLVIKHLGIRSENALYEGLAADVRGLADQGQKIAAIKRHRELTGLSLLEAKQEVEDYMNR